MKDNVLKGLKFTVVVIIIGAALLYGFEKIYPHTDKTKVLPLIVLVSIIAVLIMTRKK